MNELENIKVPELTLPGMDEAVPAPAVVPAPEAPPEDAALSEEEKGIIKQFAEKIDVTNTNMVLLYGSDAQKNVSAFSETALNKVRTRDTGEVGQMLTGLVSELKGFSFDEEQPKGLKKLFRKGENFIANLKNRYVTVEKDVDKVSSVLEGHKIQMMKDIAMLDQMYEMNLSYYKQLTMYILAGKQKLADVRENELADLRALAEQSGRPEDAQRANDLANMCDRFEKKLYDLELTRVISIQMAPQIRLVQNNDSMMAEKIQSTLVNTIPLWKNQMVLALGLHNSQKAMEAQRAVSDATNELLKKNADMLKTGSIEVAQESERGIVDLETLQYTNQSLISTLDEVLTIQQHGRESRKEAETELLRIENELKQKLLEMRG